MDGKEAWGQFPLMVPSHHTMMDVFDPKGKRIIRVWDLAYVNTFTGTRMVDVRVFREGEHKRHSRRCARSRPAGDDGQ